MTQFSHATDTRKDITSLHGHHNVLLCNVKQNKPSQTCPVTTSCCLKETVLRLLTFLQSQKMVDMKITDKKVHCISIYLLFSFYLFPYRHRLKPMKAQSVCQLANRTDRYSFHRAATIDISGLVVAFTSFNTFYVQMLECWCGRKDVVPVQAHKL